MRNGGCAGGGAHLVGGEGVGGQGMLVDEAGAAGGEGSVVELRAIPVDVVGLADGIAAEGAPRDEDTAVGGAYGDDAAAEVLAVETGVVVAGLGGESGRIEELKN